MLAYITKRLGKGFCGGYLKSQRDFLKPFPFALLNFKLVPCYHENKTSMANSVLEEGRNYCNHISSFFFLPTTTKRCFFK